MKKLVSLFMIFPIVLFQLPIDIHASEQTVSRDEHTRTYVNSNLSETAEVFPYPLFTQNPDTLQWTQKQTSAIESGSLSYVSEANPDTQYSGANEIKIGSDESGQFETYIKFGQGLPSLNGGLFLGAKLRLHELGQPGDFCYYCEHYINEQFSIHKIQQSWNANELTWTNKPQLSESPVINKTDFIPVKGPYFTWDVSNLVQEWYQNPGTDFGLAIKNSVPHTGTLRSFTTLHSTLSTVPVLQVRYSPKPQKPSAIAHGFQNTSKGTVNLQWYSVPEAKGYRVYLYNGKAYEQIYDGPATNWSSLGKNIWPTQEQINNGDATLKMNGSGADLPDQPGVVYQFHGDSGKAPDSYYFAISAYNSFGETELSEITAVKMPDATAPSVPTSVRAMDESLSNFTLTWDPSVDNSLVDYTVKLVTESGNPVFTGTTDTNQITVPESYLSPLLSYKASVMAKDQTSQSNYSVYFDPVIVIARRSQDAYLNSMTLFPNTLEAGSSPNVRITAKNTGAKPWTKEAGYRLKAEGYAITVPLSDTDIIKTGDTKIFDFQLPADMPLGNTEIKWQMSNENTGYFGESRSMNLLFEDQSEPKISVTSPYENQWVRGNLVLTGSIADYQLTHYTISYGYGSSPIEWVQIHEASATEIAGEWETTHLKNGTYTLRIEAVDGSQNKTTLTRLVYVNNEVPAPIVHAVTDKSTFVNGTAKPGTSILVLKNGSPIGTGSVNKDGTFSIPIAVQQAGTALKIISMDGYHESPAIDILVKDVTPPSQPVVNTVSNKASAIIGKTEPGAAVSIRLPTKTYNGKADTAGNFSIAIPIQNHGTAIYITVKDAAQLQSTEKKIVVTRVAPNIPVVNTVNNTDAVATGKTEKYAIVNVKIATKTYSAKADAYGNYKVSIPIQNSGTSISITARDSAGNTSALHSIKVSRVAPNVPIVNTVNNKASLVTGKTEKYAFVTIKIGTKTYSAKADVYGNYKVAIPIQNSGTKLSATAKDSAGKVSAAKSITVARVAPNMPVVNAVRYYSTAVTGKTERYALVTVKIGTRAYTAKANYYGNFKISIPKQKSRTKLAVTAKDSKGSTSAARTITVY